MQLPNLKIDKLTETINIGVGHAAKVLNRILKSPISLKVPKIELLEMDELEKVLIEMYPEELSSTHISFKGVIEGNIELVFPAKEAMKIVKIFSGKEVLSQTDDMDALRSGAMCEVANIVLNSVMGSISNMLHGGLKYSVPEYQQGSYNNIIPRKLSSTETVTVLANTEFLVKEKELTGNIIIFLKINSLQKLISLI